MSEPKDLLNGHATKVVKVLGVLGGFAAASVAAFLWIAGRMDAQAAQAVAPVQAQVQDHEMRIRAVEDMKADLRWIRMEMERRQR